MFDLQLSTIDLQISDVLMEALKKMKSSVDPERVKLSMIKYTDTLSSETISHTILAICLFCTMEEAGK